MLFLKSISQDRKSHTSSGRGALQDPSFPFVVNVPGSVLRQVSLEKKWGDHLTLERYWGVSGVTVD